MASTARVTSLYHEVRGTGPAVLLIAGATGDGGHFTRASERLADEFTIITYDRRGNSRSQAPAEPDVARISAQADDAATLVRECGFDKAVIYGNSGGAIITLELLARQPEVAKGAIVHEPPLVALLPHQEGPNPLESIFEMAQSDPRAALEMFIRANTSSGVWEGLEPNLRERILGNAETLFNREMNHFLSYVPDEATLRACGVPVVLLTSKNGLEFAPHIQALLEARLRVKGGTITGGHTPFNDMPEVFAEELRPILRSLWS